MGSPAGQGGAEIEVIREKRHKRLQRWRLWWIARRVLSDPEAGEREHRLLLDRLEGTLPGDNGGAGGEAGGTILVACDAAYLERFGPSLVRSLQRAGGTRGLHVHLCGGGDAARSLLESVTSTGHGLAVTGTHVDDPVADDLRFRSVYYTAARFLLAHHVLRRTGRPVLCMDIDVLFRRSPWPSVENALAAHDLMLTERPEWQQATRRTLAGVVGFAPSESGFRFADALARALQLGLGIGPRYHLDQITLTYLIDRMRAGGDLRVAPLPPGFLTRQAGEDAVVLVPKGWLGKGSEGFMEEQRNLEAIPRSDGPR